MTDDAVLAAIESARRIVAEEIAAHVAALRADAVAPVVVALRDRADAVVAAELQRLERRLPDLDVMQRAELEQTVRRVVDKLLHTPTVRVKELAEQPPVGSYAEALHRLFDLDPQVVEVISEAAIVEREGSDLGPDSDAEAQR
jgi:glutamyl-tRNA reductase